MQLIPSLIARAIDPSSDRFAAEQAMAYVRDSLLRLEHLSTHLLRTPRVADLLAQIRAELSVQERGLAALLQGDRSSTVAVRQAAERLLELYFELGQAQLEETLYAPFPPCDQFIKVGMNVLDGHLEPFHIESRLPAVVTLANKLEEDLERFVRFYGTIPAVEQVKTGLKSVHAGLGAALQFARTTERGPLEDSLKLLAAGFGGIHSSLGALDQEARSKMDRFKHLAIEELGRAIELKDHALVVSCWIRVEAAFYQLCAGLDSFAGFPYIRLMEPENSLAQRSVRDLGALMSKAGEHPEHHLPELDATFHAAVTAVELLFKKRLVELERYKDAPQFEELRELVYRVGNGEPFRAELDERIAVFKRRAAELPMAELAARQTEALELMGTDLEEGWKALEADLPELLAMTEAARKSTGVGSGPATVSCFKCGAANAAERRFCSACQAMLPAAAPVATTEYTDIVGGGSVEMPVTRDLAKLEALVHAAEAGNGDPDAVAREVDAMLVRAEGLLNQFDQVVVPVAHQDQTVAAYAQFFEDRVQEFVEGLATMREYAGTAGSGTLRRGFEMCRAASGELLAMKQRLDAART